MPECSIEESHDEELEARQLAERSRVLAAKKLLHLGEMRSTWKGGDPGRIIRSNSRDTRKERAGYKVQKAYFTGVNMALEFLGGCCGAGVVSLPIALQERIAEVLNEFNSAEFTDRLTAQEDIAEIDGLVDEVVAILTGQFNQQFLQQIAAQMAEEERECVADVKEAA